MNLPDLPPGLTLEMLRAGTVVSLDPAIGHPAIAIGHRNELVYAARVKLPRALTELPMGERVRQVVLLIGRAIVEHLDSRAPTAFCYERPRVYGRGHEEKDKNDLIPLALVDGGVAQGLGVPVISPWPQDWAGATKKNTRGDAFDCSRWAVMKTKLSVEEQSKVERTHDAVDAAGLLLHALGRFTRNFPGSV